jgi:predicted kinase
VVSVPAVTLRVGPLQPGDPVGIVDPADLFINVAGQHDGQEQRAAPLGEQTELVVLGHSVLIVLEHVGEYVAVRFRRQILDRPENRLTYRRDALPDLPWKEELAIPLEQCQKRSINELVVYEHPVEQLGQVRAHSPLPNAGVSEQEHDASLEAVSHLAHDTGVCRLPTSIGEVPMTLPTLIVISGPAGTGKTTLAHELGRTLGCPAICRDEIKEGMVLASTAPFVPEPGDALTRRTLAVFVDTLSLMLGSGVTVIAEATFQHNLWKASLEPLGHLARIKIVQCKTDPATARQRMAHRGTRAAHADKSVIHDDGYFDDFVRLSLTFPSIDVDTTYGYRPTLEEIVGFLRVD